jgi:hypothetical protein
MTMLAIGFALILDFLLLPALLLLGKRTPEASKAPEVALPAPSAVAAS